MFKQPIDLGGSRCAVCGELLCTSMSGRKVIPHSKQDCVIHLKHLIGCHDNHFGIQGRRITGLIEAISEHQGRLIKLENTIKNLQQPIIIQQYDLDGKPRPKPKPCPKGKGK